MIEHGGRRLAAEQEFPAAPRPLLDLSTGINPVAYPRADLAPECFTRLPEPEALADLEQAAARFYGVGDPADVVAAPGTQLLISLLPLLFPAADVRVLGPTYGEYWAGRPVREVGEIDGLRKADCAVVCNPNNPDGRLLTRAALLALRAQVGLLVVDEAFADFDASESLASAVGQPGLVVLRSFGKSFGLGGLRLGFCLGAAPQMRAALGPWAVSGPAIAIGRRALADAGWQEQAAARLAADCTRLDAVLTNAGLKVLGGTRLFRLAAGDPEWYRLLGQAGILVRRFARAPGLLRFGLPGDAAAWERLVAVLHPPR